jgi:hypothetical protein
MAFPGAAKKGQAGDSGFSVDGIEATKQKDSKKKKNNYFGRGGFF